MPQQIRVEILIPTLYNADSQGNRKPIEPSKQRNIKNQIIDKFGGITMYPLAVAGIWVDKKTNERFYDDCIKFEACIPEKEDLEKELEEWNQELKKYFDQFEIFMIYYYVHKI